MGKAPWPEVFAVVAVAGAIAVAIRGWPQWGSIESQTVAAWVQAIGSIGAILGAFFIAKGQDKAAKTAKSNQERTDLLESYNLAVAIAIDAAQAVRESSVALMRHSAGKAFVGETDRLEEAQFQIRSFLPVRCPATFTVDMIRLQRIVVYSKRALNQRQKSSVGFNNKTHDSAARRATDAANIMLKFAAARNELRDEARN